MTTGCLTLLIALITALALPVSWLGYRSWHDEKANTARKDATLASILEHARATADDTAHALHTSNQTDTDALISVIWRHTQAPVITYDPARHAFTATAAQSAHYDEKALLLGGGPVRVTRCFVHTYAHRPGHAWTLRLSEHDRAVCRPATLIGGLAGLARTRLSSMYAEDLTHATVRKALDPTGRQRPYNVKSVQRTADTITLAILLSSSDPMAGQCYRFTWRIANDQRTTTAVPVSSC
ncbi:hypothetical protein [Streptomyces sp. JB150]|uniref:hypothetical protein n=1 Tax=Streptomyces sp. JB150 TaxID=2714844 RepID=UPI001408CB62|nr:hypothetical protein [Streptomyces sp. JB150]QIJ60652.1 hypothetical protein G7Z13_00320 [Streptomyces sp. JB150]